MTNVVAVTNRYGAGKKCPLPSAKKSILSNK
jgi:hypothetical protein